jgi:hypothetical protein
MNHTDTSDGIAYSLCFQGQVFVGWRLICCEDGDPHYCRKDGRRWYVEAPFEFNDTEPVPLSRVPMPIRTAVMPVFRPSSD